MFCKNCGQEIDDKAMICPHCGVSQNQNEVVDNGGFGWGILGCCLPVVGLVLYLVWKDSKPKTAKAAGVGALICVSVSLLYYILIVAFGIGVGMS